MDSWFPDDDKKKKFDAMPAEEAEAEAEPAFSTNCAKCGAHTREHPELRGWWPAINGKLCEERAEPSVYPSEELTWYCKRCCIEENSNVVLRVIRKFLN